MKKRKSPKYRFHVIKRRFSNKLNNAKKIPNNICNTSILRVPTGVKGFDRLIEGGFKKGAINLIAGNSGVGKTIFSMQYLIEGIKRCEKVLYITFEEKKDLFYRNMCEFGWDLNKYEQAEKFFFLEYTPEKVKNMLEEGGGTVENIIVQNKISRVVIDSFTSFEILFDKEIHKREASMALFDILRRWGCTCLLTLQKNPVECSKGGDGANSCLEFEADSIILMYFFRKGKERKRFIEVLKMRGTNHSREVFPFEISSKGIEIKNRPYIDGLA